MPCCPRWIWFRAGFLATVALALISCSFNYAPPDNSNFKSAIRLSDLDGTYSNRGEGAPGGKPMPLSFVIWPVDDTRLNHPDIVSIEVRAIDENSLRVRALGVQGPLKEEVFVAGRDFDLIDGRIRIYHEFDLLTGGTGDPLLGPRYEEIDIGLDQKGHAKYKSSFSGAGLVYLLVPIAMSGVSEVRYPRVGN